MTTLRTLIHTIYHPLPHITKTMIILIRNPHIRQEQPIGRLLHLLDHKVQHLLRQIR
jgi:hypothetical protein